MVVPKDQQRYSCADCHVRSCRGKEGNYPLFCPTSGLDDETRNSAMALLRAPENNRVAVAAAEVESEGYGDWCRIEDTISFARKLNVHKIGIANCIGFTSEAQTLKKILLTQGFDVVAVSCKVGAVSKIEIGIPKYCERQGVNMCNPVLQAKILNQEGMELNIVLGLCVGHDSLFYKYSEALCTTLVVKDRATGHNSVAPLYLTETYFKRLLWKGNPIQREPR